MESVDLKKAAKEINKIVEDDDFAKLIKDKKASEEDLSENLIEAWELLADDEKKKMSKTTKSIMDSISEEEEEQELDLEDMVIDASDLKALKTIIKTDDTFKGLRKGIGLKKDEGKLRKEMLAVLKEDQETPDNTKKADKKGKPIPKKEGSMAQFVDALINKGGTLDTIAEKCQEEAEKRGTKTISTRSLLVGHIKYRISKGMEVELTDKKVTPIKSKK